MLAIVLAKASIMSFMYYSYFCPKSDQCDMVNPYKPRELFSRGFFVAVFVAFAVVSGVGFAGGGCNEIAGFVVAAVLSCSLGAIVVSVPISVLGAGFSGGAQVALCFGTVGAGYLFACADDGALLGSYGCVGHGYLALLGGSAGAVCGVVRFLAGVAFQVYDGDDGRYDDEESEGQTGEVFFAGSILHEICFSMNGRCVPVGACGLSCFPADGVAHVHSQEDEQKQGEAPQGGAAVAEEW